MQLITIQRWRSLGVETHLSLPTFKEQAGGKLGEESESLGSSKLATTLPKSPPVFQILHDRKFSVFQTLCDMRCLVLMEAGYLLQ